MTRKLTEPVVWTAALDAKLGTMPDEQLAEMAGCSGESVRRRRAKLKVDASRPERSWTTAAIALLGTMPDVDVAKRLRVTPLAVKIQRHRQGIPVFRNRVGGQRKSSRSPNGRPAAILSR